MSYDDAPHKEASRMLYLWSVAGYVATICREIHNTYNNKNFWDSEQSLWIYVILINPLEWSGLSAYHQGQQDVVWTTAARFYYSVICQFNVMNSFGAERPKNRIIYFGAQHKSTVGEL